MWPLVLRGGLLRCIGLPSLLLEINEWLPKKHGFFFGRVNYPNVEFGLLYETVQNYLPK